MGMQYDATKLAFYIYIFFTQLSIRLEQNLLIPIIGCHILGRESGKRLRSAKRSPFLRYTPESLHPDERKMDNSGGLVVRSPMKWF